jgi:transposase-like protein
MKQECVYCGSNNVEMRGFVENLIEYFCADCRKKFTVER